MKRMLICCLAILAIHSAALAADIAGAVPEHADRSNWHVGIFGGYAFYPAGLWNVDIERYDNGKQDIDVADDSLLLPGALGGLCVAYTPDVRFINYGVGLEAHYSQIRGEFKGDVELDGTQGEYDVDVLMSNYRVNAAVWIYFTQSRFRPYTVLGGGVLYTDTELGDEKKEEYAGGLLAGIGLDMYAHKLISFGVEIRFEPALGMQFAHDLSDTDKAKIDLQYLPLSALASVKFHL